MLARQAMMDCPEPLDHVEQEVRLETKDHRDHQELQALWDHQDLLDYQGRMESVGNGVRKDPRDHKEQLELEDHRDRKASRDYQVTREILESRATKETQVSPD